MRVRHWLQRVWQQERRRARQRALGRSRSFARPALLARQLEERRVLSVVIDAGTPTTVAANEGEEVTLQVEFTDDTTDPHTATIDWGDGTVESVPLADLTEPNGVDPGVIAGKHTYTDDGTYTITVTITDSVDTNDSAAIAINATIANVAPQVVLNNPATANEGDTVTFTPTVTDAGDDQTAGFTYSWTVTRTSDASVVASGTNDTVSFTPADDGDYEVSFTATDQDTAATTQTATITVANVAPQVTLNNPAASNEGDTVTFTPTVTDAGDEDQAAGFTYSWTVTRVSDGAVIASGTNDTVSFVPADDGSYDVSFTATDQNGTATTATATIAVANVAPQVTLNNPATANEGDTVTFTPAVTDAGPEDQAAGFTYSWTVTRVSDGTVIASGTNDTVSFVPEDNGDYDVSFTAVDQDGVSTTATATVTVNNVAATVAPPTVDQATIDESGTVTIDGTFTDPGLLDTHTVRIHWGDGNTTDLSAGDAGFTQNAGGGAYSASHTYLDDPAGAPTQYTITVEVLDNDGGTGTNNATQVTVVNLPPVLGAVTNSGISPEGNVTVSGTFTDPGVLDTHTVVVDWGDGTTSQAVVSGNSFTADHSYLGSPNATNPTADIPISVTIIDDDGGTATTVTQAPVPATGIATPVLVVTTDIPTLAFPTSEVTVPPPDTNVVTEASQSTDVQASASSPAAASEARLVLRVISPSGEDGEEFELELDVLNQLPGWYKRLPDNHYQIVLIREDGTEVRVSDVVVRQGKPVDPNDAFQAGHRGRSDEPAAEQPPRHETDSTTEGEAPQPADSGDGPSVSGDGEDAASGQSPAGNEKGSLVPADDADSVDQDETASEMVELGAAAAVMQLVRSETAGSQRRSPTRSVRTLARDGGAPSDENARC